MSSTPPKSRRGRWWKLALAALIALGVLWLILPYVMAPLISSKLQELVTQRLNAELRIGSLRYEFPYGVRLSDAHLVSNTGGAELFSVEQARLSLTQLPMRGGPLLIERVELNRPIVQLVRDAQGALTTSGLIKWTPATTQRQRKPSDIFRLRLLTMRGGQVRYEDRTASSQSSAVMQWTDLQTTLRLTPQSAAVYAWNFAAESQPAATLDAQGTFDVDELVAEVSKLSIDAKADPANPATALPAQIQEALHAFGIQGAGRLEAAGRLPLREPLASQFKAALHLPDVHARPGDSPMTLSLQIDLEKRAGESSLSTTVRQLSAQTEAGAVDVTQARVEFDPKTRSWQLRDLAADLKPPAHSGNAGAVHVEGSLTGTRTHIDQTDFRAVLDDLSLSLKEFGEPLQHMSGTVIARDGEIRAENVVATFGQDQLKLISAHAPIEDFSKRVQLRDIVLAANVQQPQPIYPRAVGRVLAQLNPVGPFEFRGRWTIIPRTRGEGELVISTQGGALAVATGNERIPLTNISGDGVLTQDSFELRRFEGNTFDGSIVASGHINTHKPIRYDGQVALRKIDVSMVGRTFVLPSGKDTRLSGRGDANFVVHGQVNDLSKLNAQGDAQIMNGELWEVPVLAAIASKTKVARNALTAGEAAAVFEIADSTVKLSRAAVNSPALGLQGSGTVTFEGALDLDVMAALLGDWEQHLKKTGIPLVSNLVGGIAGGMQKLVNTATSQLLYQFHVTGKTSDPKIETVPAPILTETGAAIFGSMLRKEDNLLESLHEKKK